MSVPFVDRDVAPSQGGSYCTIVRHERGYMVRQWVLSIQDRWRHTGRPGKAQRSKGVRATTLAEFRHGLALELRQDAYTIHATLKEARAEAGPRARRIGLDEATETWG